MSPAQLGFMVALAAVVLGALAASAIVARSAARSGGIVTPASGILWRGRQRALAFEVPRWAFVAHRVSGLAVFAFLLLHLVDVSLFAVSAELYDEVHALYGTPVLRVFEVGLFGAIVFHAVNGVRLIVMEASGWRWLNALGAHAVVVSVSMVSTVAGGAIILGPVLW